MVIRYADGQVLETTVEMQARIWANIQRDEQAGRRPEPPLSQLSLPSRLSPPPRPPSPQDRRGRKFRGLQEHDFQRGVQDPSWRTLPRLGGMLAQAMSAATGCSFQSCAFGHRAEVHVVGGAGQIPWTKRLYQVKFTFLVDERQASFGFYIEKYKGVAYCGTAPRGHTWYWSNMLDVLQNDTVLQQQLENAMRQLHLHWDIGIRGARGFVAQVEVAQEGGLTWRRENQKNPGDITWPEFVERLKAIDIDKWCDLYLWAHMSKEQAVAARVDITKPVIEVFLALLPLYEACTRAR